MLLCWLRECWALWLLCSNAPDSATENGFVILESSFYSWQPEALFAPLDLGAAFASWALCYASAYIDVVPSVRIVVMFTLDSLRPAWLTSSLLPFTKLSIIAFLTSSSPGLQRCPWNFCKRLRVPATASATRIRFMLLRSNYRGIKWKWIRRDRCKEWEEENLCALLLTRQGSRDCVLKVSPLPCAYSRVFS